MTGHGTASVRPPGSELPARADDGAAPALSAMRGERVYALDALRAFALFGVVLGHTQLAYMAHPYGPPLWIVYDRPPSNLLTVLFWWFHPFRLPLFFFIAGFFAAQVYATRGPTGFLRHRVQRVLVPFVVAGAILLPVLFYLFAAGWWLTDRCTWDEIRRVKFGPAIQRELYGPAHLWFLEYLFLYCFGLWGVRQWRTAASAVADLSASRWDRWLASAWRPLWCAIPSALVLGVSLDTVTTHHNSFLPWPLQFTYYAIFFAFGVRFYRFRHDLARFASGGRAYLLLSLPLCAVVQYLLMRRFAGTAGGFERVVLPPLLAVYAWLALFGFLGLFQSLFTRPSPRLRYLSDAAYWVYLIHLPIVLALQLALAQVPGPVLLKCALVVTLTTALCLRSYERWGRYSVIGTALHGPRTRPPRLVPAGGTVPAPAETTARQLA